MFSPETTKRILAMGLFVLPALLVKATGIYLGRSGPVEARASTTDPTTASPHNVVSKAPTWTSRQLAATQYVVALRRKPQAVSPFLYEMREAPVQQSTVSAPPDTAPPIQSATASLQAPPKFVLKAILSSSIGTSALIDGKPCRVGDDVGHTGWIIESISGETRSAVLRDAASDRTMTIAVETPAVKGQQ